MAKRTAKKSDNTLLLVGAAAVLGVAAYALWPKSAAAAGQQPPGGPPGGPPVGTKPTVTVVAYGTGAPPGNISAGALSVPLPHFVVTAVDDAGKPVAAAVYLEAFDSSGTALFGPVTAEPPVGYIYPSALADASNEPKLVSDLRANPISNGYYFGSQLQTIMKAGGNVLIWTADANGTVLNWWLTKWS